MNITQNEPVFVTSVVKFVKILLLIENGMILACQLKNEKNNKLPSLSAISDYPSRRRKLKLYGFPEPLSHDLVARFSKRNSLINSFSEHLAFHYMAIFKRLSKVLSLRVIIRVISDFYDNL